MSNPQITVAVANAMLDAGLGSVTNQGYLRVYDGIQPASAAIAITTQVKLLEFRMAADAFPVATNAQLVAGAISAAVATATGIAKWFRLSKADGTTVMDGDVGVQGSPDIYDLGIDHDDITIGETVAVTSFTVVHPLGA